MSDFSTQELAVFDIPFQAIEGAGTLDSHKNIEDLFLVCIPTIVVPPPPVDNIPPVLLNFSPPVDGELSLNTILSFDVTDNSSFLRRIILHIAIPNVSGSEVVHNGESFNQRHYSNVANTRLVIPGGFRYSIHRDGGWPSGPGNVMLIPFAIDIAGNENI